MLIWYILVEKEGVILEKTSKKKLYMLLVPLIAIGVIMVIWILSMLLKPKVDYEAMAKELTQYGIYW